MTHTTLTFKILLSYNVCQCTVFICTQKGFARAYKIINFEIQSHLKIFRIWAKITSPRWIVEYQVRVNRSHRRCDAALSLFSYFFTTKADSGIIAERSYRQRNVILILCSQAIIFSLIVIYFQKKKIAHSDDVPLQRQVHQVKILCEKKHRLRDVVLYLLSH